MNSSVRPSRLAQLVEQVEDRRLHRHVERRHRLVGDEDVGTQREGARDRDALPLPAGELPRVGADSAVRLSPTRSSRSPASRVDLVARHDVVHAQQLLQHLRRRSAAG